MGNTNSTIKGLAADLAGTTDICDVVTDVSSAWAASYLLPEEEVLYALRSVRQELAFTNRALITVSAESSTTTRKLVERFEYKSQKVHNVQFESTGVVDRDCELNFKIGEGNFHVKVERHREEEFKGFYKALVLLGHQQEEYELEWELVKQAMATAKDTVRLSDAGRQSLNQQSDETLAWMKAQFQRTHPHCYKDIIQSALDAAPIESKKTE